MESIDENDKPRQLADHEIEYILTEIEVVLPEMKINRFINHKTFKDILSENLKEINICQSGIRDLIDIINSNLIDINDCLTNSITGADASANIDEIQIGLGYKLPSEH